MNRTKLKNYAPHARCEFIKAVTDRAAYYGLAPNRIEAMIEQGDTAIIGGKAFPRSVAAKRRALEEWIKRQGFEHVMEAVAYTWFNRLVALRFMELHGYLDHGYRMLSHPEGKVTPEILEYAQHVKLHGLDSNRVIEMKLDPLRESELYRALLIAQCNALHAAMPFLFERIDDETELLLPDNLLHSDSLIRKLVNEIDEEDWQQVEIIGWLYQFYISEKKAHVIGKVVKSEDIPAATQLFTPNWIVKYMVQNSLGRMWLATYSNSALRSKMEYYIEPAEQTEEVKAQLAAITPASIDPETITILDPACGSGHILVEAYDLLKEIYLERGYRMRDIPRLILTKNLYGLDIDDRAAQLAGFALMMKARADDRRIFEAEMKEYEEAASDEQLVNVFAIQESAALNTAEIADALINVKSKPRAVPIIGEGRLWDDLSAQPALIMQSGSTVTNEASREDVIELLELFKNGKTFGSLITVPESLAAKLPVIAKTVKDNLQSGDLYAREAARILLPFVQQAEVLASKYDCVIANPPYMGSGYFNSTLKAFVNGVYKPGRGDLYGCFILRGTFFSHDNGFIALITIPNWMFLSTFEELRNWILEEATITSFVHNGRGIFGSDFGTSSFVVQKVYLPKFQGVYKRLFDKQSSVASIEDLERRFFERSALCAASEDFKLIPGSPIAYWASNRVKEIFSIAELLGNVANPRQGIKTGDNERFIRFWFEVPIKNIGVGIDSASDAKASGKMWFPCTKGGVFRKWYGNYEHVLNWKNDGFAIRNYTDDAGRLKSRPQNTSYFFSEGITWSKISIADLSMRLLPKGFTFESIGSACFAKDARSNFLLLSFLNSCVAKYFLSIMAPTVDFGEGSISRLPIIVSEKGSKELLASEAISLAKRDWDSSEVSWDFQTFPLLRSDLKAVSLEDSFRNWESHCNANISRMQELETENNRLFIEAYGLQEELTPEVPEDQITLARADRDSDIRRLISYAIGCMMGRYSLDQPGLIYAHSDNKDFDPAQYNTFPADHDGIIPTMESEWFADDATNRFIEFIRVAWPEEHLEENLRFIAESLSPGRNEQPRETIRRYLAAGFFKDHLKTYKKRPIYWLFSSGKLRAFQCLVYLHRYNEGTLARMRTEYVIPLQGKVAARIEHLSSDIEKTASTSHRRKIQKEVDALRKQQAELQAFDEKLRHYADKRISLDLDDGVKVNYGKFGDLLAEVKAVTGGSEE